MKELFKTQIRIILIFFTTFGLYAQSPGSLDASFDIGAGFDNSIWTVALQPDGKILAAGYFTEYNGITQNHLARLNTDGTLDTSFDASFDAALGGNSPIFSIALQPDGKILVVGTFTEYNGTSQNRILRLNSDGSLDTSFTIGTGFANGTVFSIALQPDGKILVGGSFTEYNGTTQNGIVRLNLDGSLDTSFTVGTGISGTIWSIVVQPDGKILVGGDFTEYNGTTRNRIVRLNTGGTLDTSLDIGTGFDNTVRQIILQDDGKILVGGSFTEYNSTSQNRIVRLNSNGSLDTSFNTGTGFNNDIYSITLQSDGKILVGGNYTLFNNTPRNRIVYLNTDGSLDTSFTIGGGFSSWVYSVALQSDGKILVAGGFLSYNGTSQNRIARLYGDSSVGIEEIKSVIVSVYPNPTTDYFNITSEAMIQSIELYDTSGRLVRTSLVNDLESKQNISNFTNGIYFLKINTDSGSLVRKIVKD